MPQNFLNPEIRFRYCNYFPMRTMGFVKDKPFAVNLQ
jgi:hypothetical protein